MVNASPLIERNAMLPAFALRRPVTVLMTLLSALVLGGVAYFKLPIAMLPEGLDWPGLLVQLPYPNSTPKEVEQKISRPVEEILASIKGVRSLESYSSNTGSVVLLRLKQDVVVDPVYSEVKDRMERVQPELPEDLERYFIFRMKASDIPIMAVGFWQTEGNVDKLSQLLEEEVLPKLRRIDGIASIEARGLRRRRVLIELDQNRLDAHNINLGQLFQAIPNGNFTLSGGSIVEAGIQHYVRFIAQFGSLEEIRRLPLPGADLPLSSVADVALKLPEKERIIEVDGQPAVMLEIKKESRASTMKVCQQVLMALEGFSRTPKTRPLQLQVFFDQGQSVASSLRNLTSSGLWGGVFACIVLLLFLGRLGPTLLITTAIPLSLLVTVVILYFLGMSLNIGSMLGLMIGVGMLVDNSVVVVENIFRLRDEGMPPRTAALKGASEVAIAITAATVTTVIVFLPLVFMAGRLGIWMREIGLPVAISVSVSLLTALTLIPLATASMHEVRSTRQQAGLLSRLQTGYGRLLEATLEKPSQTFLGLLLVVAVTIAMASKLSTTDNPPSDRRKVFLHIHFESPQNLEGAKRAFARVANRLEGLRKKLEIKNIFLNFDTIHGDIQLFLMPQRIKLDTEQITELVRESLPQMPGTRVLLNWERQEDSSISLLLQGEDTDVLERLVREVQGRLERLEELEDLETGLEEQRQEINLRIDRQRAWRQGLDASTVAGIVALGVRGRKAGVYRTSNGDYDIILQLGEENRQNLHALKNLPIPALPRTDPAAGRETDFSSLSASGTAAPLTTLLGSSASAAAASSTGLTRTSTALGNLAEFHFRKALGEIRRYNGLATLELKASSQEKDVEKLRDRLKSALEGLALPRGYEWKLGERFQNLTDDQDQANLSGLLAAVLVFLVMGALFESFLHPITIILSLPFAYLGFVWIMAATQTPVDLLASVGLIVLIGVVVNNSIVIVHRINQLREQGWERNAAIVKAGMDRMRPVLMTALTTILGLVPMALDATQTQYRLNQLLKSLGLGLFQLGSGTSSEILYNSLGRAVIGGLVAGTLATLLLTPYFYTLFDELRLFWRRVLGSLWPAR